ncbi:reticulon-1-A isoform X3 [Hyalella azteca]|uniref:Reticulon-like protein n=1 Tax=Hyalella azteca TaxID=294128 RepID=A0A8B7P049_HYAAZ|nr:reticulon-1-A isoform X3 [Hyalella azteca]
MEGDSMTAPGKTAINGSADGTTAASGKAGPSLRSIIQPGAVFHPELLDPRVADLIYWRDPKKSGAVLASLLVLLLSLAFFSVISVFSYTALMVLFAAISFRIYKNIKQAVQKTQDGHPFKEYLSVDVSLPADHVHSAVDVLLSQLNSTLAYLQKIFLVDDLIDTCKFGCYLWVLTYIGAWLNGLTVIILLVIALFSIPKAYEQNKSQVDQFLGNVQQQVNQVLEKIKAVIPIGGGGGGNKEKDQ